MGTTAQKLQAIKNSKEYIRQAINEKGVALTAAAPLSTYADAIKKISTGGEYDPDIATEYRNHNRNGAWPAMQLPSEMGESSDKIVILLDLNCPSRYVDLDFGASFIDQMVVQVSRFNDTTMVNTESISLTSEKFQKYFSPTPNQNTNYLVIDIEGARGAITTLKIGGIATSVLAKSPDAGILEISGNCQATRIEMNTQSSFMRTMSMQYFSFYGVACGTANSLFFNYQQYSNPFPSDLQAIPEMSFAQANVSLELMFANCTNLRCVDEMFVDGKNVSNMDAAFYNCYSLTYLGEINTFTSNFPTTGTFGWAFRNCSSLNYLPIYRIPEGNYTYGCNYMYSGCSSIKNVDAIYSDLDGNGFKNVKGNYIFEKCGITYTPSTYIEGSNQNVSSMFSGCPIVIFEGSLNGTTEILNNEAFASCQAIYLSNITRSLDIRNNLAGQYNLYTRAFLLEIFNNGLQTVTTQQTLTVGAAALALLSDSDKAIATDKGWTLA